MSGKVRGGGNKEKVKSYFHKFNASRGSQEEEELRQNDPQSQLMTQNQHLMKTPVIATGNSSGRNFSPVNAAEYEPLLGPSHPEDRGRVCLVLDLDETLVHSSFRPVPSPDMILPIEIDGQTYRVYVKKRPFVDEFIRFCAPRFEVVVFTASLSKYADPLLDELDPGRQHLGTHRLFREHCSHTNGAYVKDLSLLGRPLQKICIIDNSPVAYLFQSHNALPCTSWFEDKSDTELRDFQPMLDELSKSDNVYSM
eukprot:TRINITY_DN4212_c0_g1_i13.p1 TRINITY_DN4212_c0_g1~~TRINITY_DN4212_c0_g1_i13.p1  ORF type:complete len:253 (+),score=98.63 TRINITY_DN4212_c0_g1_i13:115-873(+)